MPEASNQIQKHFQMHNIYKRSKEYLDIEKINAQEHLQEIIRRKPTRSIQTLDTRVGSSFQNSIESAQVKLQKQLHFFKRRYQPFDSNQDSIDNYLSISLADTATDNFGATLPKRDTIRASNWDRMLGRKSVWEKKSPYKNQDQFNNFSSTARSPRQLNSNSFNFDLVTSRDYYRKKSPSQLNEESMNPQNLNINYEKIGKKKQVNQFNLSGQKCLINYNKTDSRKKLKINLKVNEKKRQKINLQPLQIPQQRLDKSLVKSRVNKSPCLHQFYNTIGKDTPGQIHMKTNNRRQFYFLDKNNRTSREDFATKKRRQDMNEKRRKSILQQKQVSLRREQMCDDRYFFIKKERTKAKK